MMAVSTTAESRFEPGVAVPLFETRVTGFAPYDVAPDGRFLVNTRPEARLAVADHGRRELGIRAEVNHPHPLCPVFGQVRRRRTLHHSRTSASRRTLHDQKIVEIEARARSRMRLGRMPR